MYDKTKYIQKQEATRQEIKKILDDFIPTLVVSPEEIEKYTELVKNYIVVITDSETHTVKELMDATKALRDFYSEYGQENEEFDL